MLRKLLVVVTLACLMAGMVAVEVQGGEGEQAATASAWLFDVRVVRIDTATPEAVETPAPWEADGACTTATPWPRILEQLKARGRTTVLLDQRVTALSDAEARVRQSRDRQIQQLQNRDLTNERWSTGAIMTGCTAKLRVAGAAVLAYELDARWEIRAAKESVRPILCATQWEGTAPAIADGRTLVLSYREQVETWGESRVGQEVHAFVTVRRLPAR